MPLKKIEIRRNDNAWWFESTNEDGTGVVENNPSLITAVYKGLLRIKELDAA